MTIVSDAGPPDHLRPEFKLYSQGGIVLATALGSVLAGAFLLSRNYISLSQPTSARNTIILGLAALGAFVLAGFLEPQSVEVPTVVYYAVQVGIVSWYAKRTQGALLSEHDRLGGVFHSKWRAAGISLVVVATVFAVGFGLFLVFPDNSDYAKCAESSGNLDLDTDYCTRAIDSGALSDESLVDALHNRGINYARKGEYDSAIADFDEAIRLEPDYAVAYNSRGIAYGNKGEYDRANADFNQAVRLKPDFVFAVNNRGETYRLTGDHDRAIQDYDEAIQLDPAYAIAYYNRGLAYKSKGDHDRAILDYDEAIRLDPAYAKAYNDRGIAYGNKGDHDRAIQDYNEAIRLDPAFAWAYSNRCRANGLSRRPHEALKDCNEGLRLRPDDPKILDSRALAYWLLNEHDKAQTDLERARQIDLKRPFWRDRFREFEEMF